MSLDCLVIMTTYIPGEDLHNNQDSRSPNIVLLMNDQDIWRLRFIMVEMQFFE